MNKKVPLKGSRLGCVLGASNRKEGRLKGLGVPDGQKKKEGKLKGLGGPDGQERKDGKSKGLG